MANTEESIEKAGAPLGRRAFLKNAVVLGCALAALGLTSTGCVAAQTPKAPNLVQPHLEEASMGLPSTSGADTTEEGTETMGTTADIILVTLNGTEIAIELEDNETADTFRGMLPLSATLSELNGNEKFVYLDDDLPTAASNPGTIEKGDVMLFGSNCLVVFYETFPTSYRYTRIGRVTEPDLLDGIASAQSVEATFEVAE